MCGGLVSILIKVAVFAYFVLRCGIVFNGQGDENSSQVFLLGHEERIKQYMYDDIQFMLTPGLRDVKDGKKVLDYDDIDVRRHIELTYVQMF